MSRLSSSEPKRHIWCHLSPFSSSSASLSHTVPLKHKWNLKLIVSGKKMRKKKKALTNGPNNARRVVWARSCHRSLPVVRLEKLPLLLSSLSPATRRLLPLPYPHSFLLFHGGCVEMVVVVPVCTRSLVINSLVKKKKNI